MPKFKDLGINTIPVTMRPPAIGDGAAGGKDKHDDADTQGCVSETCVPGEDVDTEGCLPETCLGDDEEDTEGCDPETCVCSRDDDDEEEEDTEGCDPETCVCSRDDEEDTEGCLPETCLPGDKDKKKDGKNAGAFSPDAVHQLRQQLDLEIGT